MAGRTGVDLADDETLELRRSLKLSRAGRVCLNRVATEPWRGESPYPSKNPANPPAECFSRAPPSPPRRPRWASRPCLWPRPPTPRSLPPRWTAPPPHDVADRRCADADTTWNPVYGRNATVSDTYQEMRWN